MSFLGDCTAAGELHNWRMKRRVTVKALDPTGVERALEQLGELVRTRGLKSSSVRDAVARAALARRGHFTVDELIHDLRRKGVEGVHPATVYRVLPLLVEAGLLQAALVSSGDGARYERAFERVDAVVMPTSPTSAFRIGEKVEDPVSLYLTDVFTVSANLAGLPGLSVPCGLTPSRLPVGLQLTGRPFDEATLLRIGDTYERHTDWSKQVPDASVRSTGGALE